MKTLIFITIAILVFLPFSCYGLKINNSHFSGNDTITEIVDPIEIIPFSIGRDSIYIKIPDSLGINQKGFAVIGLLINDKSKIEEVVILRLFLKVNDSIIVNYTQEFNNEKINFKELIEVQKYHYFLEEYAKTLKIKKTTENIPKLTRMSLLVRFI